MPSNKMRVFGVLTTAVIVVSGSWIASQARAAEPEMPSLGSVIATQASTHPLASANTCNTQANRKLLLFDGLHALLEK